MFIALGSVTVLVGVATVLFLPDTPMKARFFSDEEKISGGLGSSSGCSNMAPMSLRRSCKKLIYFSNNRIAVSDLKNPAILFKRRHHLVFRNSD